MIKPAILYKQSIIEMCKSFYYTDAMLYETGTMDNWYPDIKEMPDGHCYQYAIVDSKDNLIGFICYSVDWYADNVYNFGMLSNQKANPLFAKDILTLLEELVKKHHRVEWRMVGGNPIEKHYDKFCKKHCGNKYVLKDSIKDKEGNYRANVIYEIIRKEI